MPPTIAWKDGTPPRACMSACWTSARTRSRLRAARGAVSGTDGRFVVDARKGRAYRLVAHTGGTGSLLTIAAPRIQARASLGPIALVIHRDPPR
jgi:hypothetical protein